MMDSVRLRLNTEFGVLSGQSKRPPAYIDGSLDQEVDKPEDDRLTHSIDATAAELAEVGRELAAEAQRAQAADADDEGPIIRLVNLIIDTAYHMRASDIHVEPMADRVRIRYRVDGVCLEKDNIPKNMQAPLVTRLKILSGMDIAEKRLPQDGRIKRNIAGQDIDFRVSSLPGNHGPSVVLRILRPDAVISHRSLGFEQDNYETFQRIIKRPKRHFPVTGRPVGQDSPVCRLEELNKRNKKIFTARTQSSPCLPHDSVPGEGRYWLSFDRSSGSCCARAEHHLVGEIRDSEVADNRHPGRLDRQLVSAR
jgi:type IV pilus assembly protein PilB